MRRARRVAVLAVVAVAVMAGWMSVAAVPHGTAAEVAAQGGQVARGEAGYAQACAACHGVDLEGDTGPALAGSTRIGQYGTAARLYLYTRGTMPLDAPGSLSEEMYYDIVAYVLSRNQLLPPDLTIDASNAGSLHLRN